MQKKLDKTSEQDAVENKNNSWHDAEEILWNQLTLRRRN